MNTHQGTLVIDTPLGPMGLLASDMALLAACFDPGDAVSAPNALCHEAAAQLNDYFAGRRTHFDLPLAAFGTHFQQQVWQTLRQVAWGQRLTYGELAERLGRPGAARAVGAAVGRNPLAVFIPCHRILGSQGRLTGFAWGLDRKRALLALEGYDARS